MTKLPSLTGEQVIKALNSTGFQVIRQRVSHKYHRHPDNRAAVVPVHKGETIGPGLLRKIIHDTELSREDFLDLL